MKRLKIYIDTSVIGGCFDKEFIEESQALLRMVEGGKMELIVSDLLAEELELAPLPVQEKFGALPPDRIETILQSEESEHLCSAYLAADVVGPSHRNDAHHIALATISCADLIVSWNFKHIVHYEQIRGFNAVNLQEGYAIIDIRSPKEVV